MGLLGAPKGLLFRVPFTNDHSGQSAQALETANLKPGQRVLVHAGAGGVGVFAVQMAKVHWGAFVMATGGPRTRPSLPRCSRCTLPATAWALR